MDDIEAGLERGYSGLWERLDSQSLKAQLPSGFVNAWRVIIPPGSVRLAVVDHLLLAIDHYFPNSQPRVFAPQAGSTFSWPHVEPNGCLCLSPTLSTVKPADRVVTHLADALDLLNYSEERCRNEFYREFSAYWGQRATNGSGGPGVFSLVSPGGLSREVCYFFDSQKKNYIIGDSKSSLSKWLCNSQINHSEQRILKTRLIRLDCPWLPECFPEYGRDVLSYICPDEIRELLTSAERCPLLFEAETPTGTVYAAVELCGVDARKMVKGFRHISRVPTEHVANFFRNRPVVRCNVTRVDGSWVHGRDHQSGYMEVKNRKVAIVGCGSIGSYIARLLAQAGVGELILVDGDTLSSGNVSRHQFGVDDVGLNKAALVCVELRRQFPHLTFDYAFSKHFEKLSFSEKEHLSTVDLIIAAGIDLDGELALDSWRTSLSQPPAYISTWVEAYALAGHAVLIYGSDSIREVFDTQERPLFRLTDWPPEARTSIVEAGCGNSFQPHGVVDLHPSVGLAATLALDVLQDRVPASCRRVWMGDPNAVERCGGKLRAAFTDTFCIREYAWP